MIIPDHLFEPIRKIQDTNLICPPVVSQYAAVGAMKAGRPYCAEKLRETAEIRHILLNELAKISDLVTVPRADGAFYFLLRVHGDHDPMDLARKLIEEHKVAVLPGMTFGVTDHCYLRVAYGALHKATAEEGIARLITGLRALLS